MAQINAAYDQIKSGTANSTSYASPFERYYQRSSSSGSSAPDYLKSAAQFIKTGQYQQAVNLLNTIEDRNARWYYLSAIANMSLGNQAVAEDHIKSAYAKEPDNITYQQAYQNIINGVNPINQNPFSSFYDFSGGQNRSNERRTYTVKARPGCLSRIFKIILIIIAIRLALRLILSGVYRVQQRHYQPPTQSYSQQYDDRYGTTSDAESFFGSSNGEESNQS